MLEGSPEVYTVDEQKASGSAYCARRHFFFGHIVMELEILCLSSGVNNRLNLN